VIEIPALATAVATQKMRNWCFQIDLTMERGDSSGRESREALGLILAIATEFCQSYLERCSSRLHEHGQPLRVVE